MLNEGSCLKVVAGAAVASASSSPSASSSIDDITLPVQLAKEEDDLEPAERDAETIPIKEVAKELLDADAAAAPAAPFTQLQSFKTDGTKLMCM